MGNKDLPESKPEPHRHCGNCSHHHSDKEVNADCPNLGRACYAWKLNEVRPDPEPEKNCGNCARHDGCVDHSRDQEYDCWQPKAAEPQKAEGWEQKFDLKFGNPCPSCLASTKAHCNKCSHTEDASVRLSKEQLNIVKSFIRSEIERAEKRGEDRAIAASQRLLWRSEKISEDIPQQIRLEIAQHGEGGK